MEHVVPGSKVILVIGPLIPRGGTWFNRDQHEVDYSLAQKFARYGLKEPKSRQCQKYQVENNPMHLLFQCTHWKDCKNLHGFVCFQITGDNIVEARLSNKTECSMFGQYTMRIIKQKCVTVEWIIHPNFCYEQRYLRG